MPHFHIDYSRNLEDAVDMGAFCDAIRREAVTIDAFAMPGIRVRATCVDHYSIANGNPDHGFVDISIRLREGRSDAVKLAAVTQIFEAARSFLEAAMSTRSIALSAEMRDIDAALSPKCSTIRDHLEATP